MPIIRTLVDLLYSVSYILFTLVPQIYELYIFMKTGGKFFSPFPGHESQRVRKLRLQVTPMNRKSFLNLRTLMRERTSLLVIKKLSNAVKFFLGFVIFLRFGWKLFCCAQNLRKVKKNNCKTTTFLGFLY